MDSGGRIHMGYEVWSSLLKSRMKNSLRNRENALGTRIWTELERYLECLNEEDLNEPNIAIRRVNECSEDSAPQESVLSRLGVQSGINRLCSPIAPLCVVVLVSMSFLPRRGSLDRRLRPKTVGPGRPRDLLPGLSECSLNVSRCSGIVLISVFHECAPKIYQEAFATTETSLGEPRRVPKGRLKLVPRPRWSLSACKSVLGCRLLVSGAGPGSPVRKGVCERSGVFRPKCFGRKSSVGTGGPKWGADNLPLFGCVLD
ncbi:hypothetical protein CRG98_024374 [Punica granatum]|uniref:Uncharacterized protein n=1 Tax=Punica granatum TaxID=22663 RepID=A0A2I0JHZ9_PUNGR|nr:hypothetical protein CRG98_024374 [Punica granatum]